jgi:Holliday junction resolvase RusA-like endonuclease
VKIVIPLPLATLNEYTNDQRTNPHKGAKTKRTATRKCTKFVRYAMSKKVKFAFPCRLKFTWFDSNKKKDPDNIAFQKKFILDGMIEAGFMENDGWKHIKGFSDYFEIDKENPRVEIEIEETL